MLCPTAESCMSDRDRQRRAETIDVFLKAGLKPHPADVEWVCKTWPEDPKPYYVCKWLGKGPYGRFSVDIQGTTYPYTVWEVEYPQRHPCPRETFRRDLCATVDEIRQKVLHLQGRRGVPNHCKPEKYDRWGNRVTGPWDQKYQKGRDENDWTLWDVICGIFGKSA